jgi:hypothetical protein
VEEAVALSTDQEPMFGLHAASWCLEPELWTVVGVGKDSACSSNEVLRTDKDKVGVGVNRAEGVGGSEQGLWKMEGSVPDMDESCPGRVDASSNLDPDRYRVYLQ